MSVECSLYCWGSGSSIQTSVCTAGAQAEAIKPQPVPSASLQTGLHDSDLVPRVRLTRGGEVRAPVLNQTGETHALSKSPSQKSSLGFGKLIQRSLAQIILVMELKFGLI